MAPPGCTAFQTPITFPYRLHLTSTPSSAQTCWKYWENPFMYLSPTCYSETQKQQHVRITDPKLTTSVGIAVFPCGDLVQRPSNSKRIITAEHRIWANHSNDNPRIEGCETQLCSQMLKFKSSFTPTEDIPGRQNEG